MSDTDFDELERAYNHALDLEKAGRLDEAARAWRRVLEIDPEDCGGAAVRLAAMQRGKTPERASPAYVMTLFDQHAEAFDDILVRQLGYDVPNMIARALATHAPGPYPRLLDLGCGTGLCAVALEAITRERVGVDLSEAMIELAAERDLYDDLYIGDITGFLEDDNGRARLGPCRCRRRSALPGRRRRSVRRAVGPSQRRRRRRVLNRNAGSGHLPRSRLHRRPEPPLRA